MSKSTSCYPSLLVDTTGTGVVSQAGAITLLRTAEKTGLTAGLSAARSPAPTWPTSWPDQKPVRLRA